MPASFALAVIMLPLVARSTIEVLALVPNSLREAALGVGSPRWRTTLGIVLPQAIGGILTGATLAVARVAGETAPLLLMTSLVGEGIHWNPAQPLAERSGRDLRADRFARSGRPRARLGGGARADHVHPRHEPDRALARHSQSPQACASRQMSQMKEEPVSASSTIEPAVRVETKRQPLPPRERLEQVFDIQDLTAIYGSKPALKNVSMEVYKNLVTAVIGPSGLRQEHVHPLPQPDERPRPELPPDGDDPLPRAGHLRASDVDPVAVRRTIGMVFQRPNPFPKSIYDNVAWGLKVLGMKDNLSERVERASRRPRSGTRSRTG